MAKKSKNLDREYTREQRYQRENKKLKRENARLKKLISRLDLEEHLNLKQAILKQEKDNQIDRIVEKQQKEEEAWACHKCDMGVLRLKIFEIRDGTRYYRKCDRCSNRTKGKEYTKEVKGVE